MLVLDRLSVISKVDSSSDDVCGPGFDSTSLLHRTRDRITKSRNLRFMNLVMFADGP